MPHFLQYHLVSLLVLFFVHTRHFLVGVLSLFMGGNFTKILWRLSAVRERSKRRASNQARNRTSCCAKHATVERVATPRSSPRNTEVNTSLRQLVATQQ
jgi:hypothetical protein